MRRPPLFEPRRLRVRPRRPVPAGLGRLGLPQLRLLVLSLLTLCGCTVYQDIRDEITYKFHKPDPMQILKDSESGEARAKALSTLATPGKDHAPDKEACLKILCTAAVGDRDPLCRLQAVRALGHFKSPESVESLEKAFDKARDFPVETATTIREQALVSLGETGEPSARKQLIEAARAGAAEDSKHELQQSLDLRLTALRALGHFKQYDVTETLQHVLASEKDVALRDRAYQSLVEATGKHLPPDPKAWEELLHKRANPDGVAQEPAKKFSLVAWWPFNK